ncbi:hypothetical protein ABZY81_23445 [Streptomyces sp. NPDC006514]|uniref:hypothetical protein n=1 Tax=Streptomyces sp. NPDC006514 TaxID=3154308 RepID=UPI0033BB570F
MQAEHEADATAVGAEAVARLERGPDGQAPPGRVEHRRPDHFGPAERCDVPPVDRVRRAELRRRRRVLHGLGPVEGADTICTVCGAVGAPAPELFRPEQERGREPVRNARAQGPGSPLPL